MSEPNRLLLTVITASEQLLKLMGEGEFKGSFVIIALPDNVKQFLLSSNLKPSSIAELLEEVIKRRTDYDNTDVTITKN